MFGFIGPTLRAVLIADLLATSGDITATWTSPIYTKLQSNDSSVNPFGYPITNNEETWIGALVYIGGIFGAIPYGIFAAKFGRKPALLCIAIPHIMSYLTLAFARKIYLYYLARFVGGFAYGGGYTVLPTYIAEIAQDSNRGMLSVTLNVFWCFGNLIPYVIGPYISIMYFNLILACIPALFFLLFLFFGPETPYFLLRNNKRAEAETALTSLRSGDKKSIDEELKHMEEVLKHDENGKLSDLFQSKSNVKALAISLTLITAQQFTGLAAVLLYTQEIFEAAGVKNIPSHIASMIVGLVLFLSSAIAPCFTDRLGRRPLLNISWLGMAVFLMAFGTYYKLQAAKVNMSAISWLPITSLVFYIITMNVGAGPLIWTLSAEMFPASVKSIATAMVSLTCWVMAVIVSKFFEDWNENLGKDGTFFMFCGCCLVGLVVSFVFVPETKGKSFAEIQEILEK